MTIERLKQINARCAEFLDKPISVTKISVEVGTPYVGWIDITLTTSEGESYTFNMSHVYDPLEEFRYLLEGWYAQYGVREIEIDCERYRAILGMQPLFVEDETGAHFPSLLKCYDDLYVDEDDNKGEVLVAWVDKSQVALAIYTALKDRILNSDYDSEDWHINDLPDEEWDNAEKFRQYLFEKRIKSEYLERMIKIH